MMEGSIYLVLSCIGLWALVGVFTAAARDNEISGQEAAAVAAGVLWPIYLPYRLALIVRSGRP